MKVILTGATGMVGEGVLLECLQNGAVSEVLVVARKHYEYTHPKLKELLILDFQKAEDHRGALTGYDACFYCAGISVIGLSEAEYTRVTYDTTLAFANTLLKANPASTFIFVSGRSTDSTEKGRAMWARVKGRTENALMKLGFKGQYNFRPALMVPVKGQRNVKTVFRVLIPILKYLLPGATLTLEQVGRAMINSVTKGYSKQVLEVEDIRILAG